MKLLKKTDDKFVFELLQEEKELLGKVLKYYPFSDHTKFELSKTIKDEQISQSRKILLDALTEHQNENKKLIRDFFENPDVLKPKSNPDYYVLELDADKFERLLQILNNVRVGSWQKLGCPELENSKRVIRSSDEIILLYIMDVCEYFEYYLLKALDYQ